MNGNVAGELSAREEAKNRKQKKSQAKRRLNVVLHNVHRAEEKGAQNSYYGGLTNKGKLV